MCRVSRTLSNSIYIHHVQSESQKECEGLTVAQVRRGLALPEAPVTPLKNLL